MARSSGCCMQHRKVWRNRCRVYMLTSLCLSAATCTSWLRSRKKKRRQRLSVLRKPRHRGLQQPSAQRRRRLPRLCHLLRPSRLPRHRHPALRPRRPHLLPRQQQAVAARHQQPALQRRCVQACMHAHRRHLHARSPARPRASGTGVARARPMDDSVSYANTHMRHQLTSQSPTPPASSQVSSVGGAAGKAAGAASPSKKPGATAAKGKAAGGKSGTAAPSPAAAPPSSDVEPQPMVDDEEQARLKAE